MDGWMDINALTTRLLRISTCGYVCVLAYIVCMYVKVEDVCNELMGLHDVDTNKFNMCLSMFILIQSVCFMVQLS